MYYDYTYSRPYVLLCITLSTIICGVVKHVQFFIEMLVSYSISS